MPLYSYQATNYSGEVIKGSLDAPDEGKVVAHIQSEGLIPVKIKKTSKMSLSLSNEGGKKVKQATVAIFTMELSTLLEAGLSLDRSLYILIGMEEGAEWKRVLEKLLEKVKSGNSLSDAMKSHEAVFSKFYVSLIHAGEVSGALNVVLERLSEHQEKELEMRASIRKALFYPILLIVVGISVIGYLLLKVVPQFESMIEKNKTDLPFISDVIFGMSVALRNYWYIILIVIIFIVVVSRSWLKNPEKKPVLDKRILGLPMFGVLARKTELARASRTLGTMLTYGVPLVVALRSVKETVSNSVLGSVLDDAMDSLKAGKGMAKVMIDSKQFPALGVQMIKVGEETGKLEKMLMKVADIYDKDVKDTIDGIVGIIGPLAILFIAGMVAMIMAGVIMAIMSLSG